MSDENNTSTSSESSENSAGTQVLDRVKCSATRDPVVRALIGAVMAAGIGVWCFLDRGNYPYAPFDEDINKWSGWAFNHGMAVIGPVIGLVVFVWVVMFLRRKLVADSDGIDYGMKKFPWSDVDELDATELKDKGILYLRYGDGKTMKLDGWKLTDFRKLVALVEKNVPAEKHKT